jgi:hypothetical protein
MLQDKTMGALYLCVNVCRGGGMEREVRSAVSDMGIADLQEVLGGPSVSIIEIVLRYRVICYTVVFPQLQLWNLYWLVSVGDAFTNTVRLTFPVSHKHCCSRGNTLASGRPGKCNANFSAWCNIRSVCTRGC